MGRIPKQRAPDVDRAVGPRGHRQVLDDLRDALVAVDEHDVAGANPALQPLRVIEDVTPVLAARAGDAAHKPPSQSLAGRPHAFIVLPPRRWPEKHDSQTADSKRFN